jgi:hypothetical protein
MGSVAKHWWRGELVELVVDRLGARGDGVAEHEGAPVFLPYAAPGDRVRARLGAPRAGGREGRVVELIASGPGAPIPPADISAVAAAARCSISIPPFIGRRSSAGCAPRSNGSGLIPIWCSRCGSYRWCGGGRGSG